MKKQKSFSTQINLQVRIFFRHYPAIVYIFKWLFISLLIGVCIGSASAGFLQSLDWVTNYRESHFWIIAILPVAGLAIGLLYYYWGKDIEAGSNLLIDSIHNPRKIIPFRMAPVCVPRHYGNTCIWRLCRKRRYSITTGWCSCQPVK